MCEKYVERPLYLLIADWMMAEDRWITAKEISRHFDIDSHLYSRLNHNLQEKKVSMAKTPRLSAVPPTELNREQKWQMMLSKSMRR